MSFKVDFLMTGDGNVPECLREDTFMLEKLAEQNKVIGIKQTTKALNQDKAKTLFIAEDAEKHLVQHLEQTAKEKNIKIVYVDSMKNLGKACGIEVGAAAAAITE